MDECSVSDRQLEATASAVAGFSTAPSCPASHDDTRAATILENPCPQCKVQYRHGLPKSIDLGNGFKTPLPMSHYYILLLIHKHLNKTPQKPRTPFLTKFSPITITIMLLLPTITALLSLFPQSILSSSSQHPNDLTAPTPPGLEYLYTAFVDCTQSLYETQGPAGIRKAIPIVGGNFTGPRGLEGRILDLGADWGSTDPQTGIFTADTRYV